MTQTIANGGGLGGGTLPARGHQAQLAALAAGGLTSVDLSMVCVVPLRPEVPSWSRSVDGGVRLRLPSIEAFDVGSGTPCVPVYDPDIFIALQKAGANMAVLSMPGPFQASLPYEADPDAVRLLDYLVGAAAIAGLFIVIAFRTSPGRNDKDLLNLLPGPLERTLPLIRIGKRLRDASSISRSMPAQHVA